MVWLQKRKLMDTDSIPYRIESDCQRNIDQKSVCGFLCLIVISKGFVENSSWNVLFLEFNIIFGTIFQPELDIQKTPKQTISWWVFNVCWCTVWRICDGDTAKKHGFALSLWLTAGKCKWIRYASLVKVVMLESHWGKEWSRYTELDVSEWKKMCLVLGSIIIYHEHVVTMV